MKVVFRVDASNAMGSGHVMRCLVLANDLRKRGASIHFICRNHPGHMISAIKDAFFHITVLEYAGGKEPVEHDNYLCWLGVSQSVDAEQTLLAIKDERVDWLIVDHYALDNDWHSVFRDSVKSICVIDDLANRHYECDLLLDSNYAQSPRQRYENRVPSNCSLLLGPKYALLTDNFKDIRRTMRSQKREIRNILIYFGGSDHHDMTGLCLSALSGQEFGELTFNVVLGQMNLNIDSLKRLFSHKDNIHFHTDLVDLSEVICEADIGLGGSGVTTWERLCLGLPSIVVTIAENQRPTANALFADNYITYLGPATDVTAAQIKDVVTKKIGSSATLASESERSKLLVDGYGLFRVSETICPTPFNRVSLQHVDRRVIKTDLAGQLQSRLESKEDTPHIILFKINDFILGKVIYYCQDDAIELAHDFDELAVNCGWHKRMLGQSMRALTKNVSKFQKDGTKIQLKSKWKKYIYTCSSVPSFDHDLLNKNRLRLAILSSESSWLNDYIEDLVWHWLDAGFEVLWVHDKSDLLPGDFCFYLGCEQIVGKDILCQFEHNLVVHESDLPHGRGWSPLTWQILEGAKSIPIVLFEASEILDSGQIYLKETMNFSGTELLAELRDAQASATLRICKRFVDEYPKLVLNPTAQSGEATIYKKRTPLDSKISEKDTIESIFPLLRVADYEKYPVFFDYGGVQFKIKIEVI